MRPLLSLKTLLRTPIKTLVTFILLAAISFALFSRAAEYTVATREFERVIGNYRGVGTVQSEQPPEIDTGNGRMLIYDPRVRKEITQIVNVTAKTTSEYAPLSKADMEVIAALPYITSTSTRYMTAGLSEDGFIRADANEYYYNYASNLIIEATLTDVKPRTGGDGGGRIYELSIGECVIIAGDTSIELDEPKIDLSAYPTKLLTEDGMFADYADGMGIRLTSFCLEKYDFDFIDSLKEGDRYLFSVRYNQSLISGNTSPTFWMADVISQSQWLSTIIPLDGKSVNYLETEEFAALRKYIDVVNNDIKTFDMVAFEAGRLYAIIGPSGSGKSTLLSMLAGLDLPMEGEVVFDGDSLSKLDLDRYRRENIAMIFQMFQLFPLLTVMENVCYPMELCGVK